jgi:hypothetical protein
MRSKSSSWPPRRYIESPQSRIRHIGLWRGRGGSRTGAHRSVCSKTAQGMKIWALHKPTGIELIILWRNHKLETCNDTVNVWTYLTLSTFDAIS